MAALIVSTAIWATPGLALAQDVENRPWSEILIVVGRDIALSLPDGYVEGRATAVTADALELDVRTTSNKNAYPPGHTTIARPLVSSIRMRKSDGRAPRVASQTIGQAAVFGGLLGLGSRNNGLKGMAQGAGVSLGAATLGSVIGRKLDDREIETVIRIVPEPTDAEIAKSARYGNPGATRTRPSVVTSTMNPDTESGVSSTMPQSVRR